METITTEYLKDEDNHIKCECDNTTIPEYSWSDDNGANSCPLCMVSFQSSQIKMYRDIIKELVGKSKTKAEINELLKTKFAEDVYCCKVDDFEYNEDFFDKVILED